MLALFYLLSCDTPETNIPKWHEQTGALIEQCKSETVPELKTFCWLQAGIQSAEEKNYSEAIKSCAQLSEKIWQSECHFRVAEARAINGEWLEAISLCGDSGRFAKNCVSHALWRTSLRGTPSNTASAAQIKEKLQVLKEDTQKILQRYPSYFVRTIVHNLEAQFTHSVIVGKGKTRVDLAHESGTLGAYFRTAYGMEAARILVQSHQLDIETVVQTWREERDVYGAKNKKAFNGRYRNETSSQRRGKGTLVFFSEQSRLTAKDPEKDMYLAALEGAFWVAETKEDVFTPYLEHPDKDIRATSKRIVSHFRSR